MQHCLLYCALYPEDFKILKDELIGYWIVEGLVDDMDSVQATYDRGHTILNRLVNNCLLENVDDGRCVKMHDLVREMALHITRKSPLFMTKAGTYLEELPSEEEWPKNLEKASMRNRISDHSLNMSPNCQTLSTLLLQQSYYISCIPKCFFVHMHGLKILDLSYTPGNEGLPNSVSDLTNLKALLLKCCYSLQHFPCLEKLVLLEKLDLRRTRLRKVPEGMVMLTNLRYLDIFTETLEMFPAGILPKLCHLQVFKVYWLKTSRETIEEVGRLRKLYIFEVCFFNLQHLNLHVKSLDGRGPLYKYSIWAMSESTVRDWISFENIEALTTRYFRGGDKCLVLWDCSIYESDKSLVLRKDVSSLWAHSCDARSISNFPSFERLDALRVSLCNNLNVLFRDEGFKYSHLTSLSMRGCSRLKKLLSAKLLQALPNLANISLELCSDMEEIIALDTNEEEKDENTIIFTFPNLKELHLTYLLELKRICSSPGVLVCDSLQEIEVLGCPKLKRLPLSLTLLDNGQPSPPAVLKRTICSRDWWESLEWDNVHVKNVLQPYCQISYSQYR